MEAFCMNLRSQRSECIGKIKSIKTTEDTTYFLADSETKYLRIFEAQWQVYNYINTLHALWGFTVGCDPYIDGNRFSLRNQAPKLLALRNCMQHSGPIRVNYLPKENELAVSVLNLKQKGQWGGDHRPFSDYFQSVQKGDLLLLRDSIEQSDAFYKNIARELEREHTKNYTEEELRKAAEKLSLYS